jgi:hypothetical protein
MICTACSDVEVPGHPASEPYHAEKCCTCFDVFVGWRPNEYDLVTQPELQAECEWMTPAQKAYLHK